MSNWRGDKKTLFAGFALGLAILLLISVNLLSNSVFRNLRVDLTQDKLFTLSDGTEKMLAGLEEPVLLRFIFLRIWRMSIPRSGIMHAEFRIFWQNTWQSRMARLSMK